LNDSEGQDLVHDELIMRLVENLLLPEEIAIGHGPGHQGNNFAEEAAKEDVCTQRYQYYTSLQSFPPCR
jgi:hypothetical protein